MSAVVLVAWAAVVAGAVVCVIARFGAKKAALCGAALDANSAGQQRYDGPHDGVQVRLSPVFRGGSGFR